MIPANGKEGKTANQIYDYVSVSQEWEQIDRINGNLDHAAAQQMAANGYIVLAVYKNPSGASGHVVFVTNRELKDGKVEINGLNTLNEKDQRVETEPFSIQFKSSGVVNGTQFFYYKTKIN
jgi:hypothetical protein